VFFQSRERANPYYDAFRARADAMDRFGELTGRTYSLFDYVGAWTPSASSCSWFRRRDRARDGRPLLARGEKVGVLKVRLYRPFSPGALLDALPATAESIAVLDRCKEPGADGEPLYKDVVTALAQASVDGARAMPVSSAGAMAWRAGIHPGMVKAVFDELAKTAPKLHEGLRLSTAEARERSYAPVHRRIHDDSPICPAVDEDSAPTRRGICSTRCSGAGR